MSGIVDSLVDSVAPPTSAVGGLAVAPPGADFQLGALSFKIAASDDRPYERATSQFRKDQVDTQTSPGDQSLVGWWLRGQPSFHKGAGIVYYEVSDGPTVLNRYASATGINPWVPGTATLSPALDSAGAGTAITRVASAGDNVAMLDAGALKYGPVGSITTEVAPPTDTNICALAGGNGDFYYATTDNHIYRLGLNETTVTVYGEEGFEAGVDSWDFNSVFGDLAVGSVSSATDKAFEDTHSLKAAWPDIGSTNGAWFGRQVDNLVVGRTYTFVAKVWVPTGVTVMPDVLFYAEGPAVATFDAWTTVALTFTATDTTHFVGFRNATPASGTFTWVDKAVIYQGSRSDYDTGGVPLDDLYAHGQRIVDLFYAKDRLFMVDLSNTWYQLSPDPASPPASTSGNEIVTMSGAGGWCLSDTPGPVLVGNGNRVFAFTPDSTGAVPTLAAPVQVAALPLQETVRAIYAHLGLAVLVTTRGVRVCTIDTGGVTYGPLLFEWGDCPSYTSVAATGSRVVVTGDHKVFEVDLSEQIANADLAATFTRSLQFAYTNLPSMLVGEVNYGATNAPDGRVLLWGDADVWVQSADLVASGDLTTGLHRYATLEGKKFQAVKVQASGTGGTITVAKVTAGGSETSLYTMDLSRSDTAEIGLSAPDPLESLALKFTLARSATDATKGPTLLGYQLRALPAPRRQRSVRVPLECYDIERRGPGRATGSGGSAWARLQALEDMEASGGTFLFRDLRTGEAGECFVESVEFSNKTPPTAKSTGFGGTVFVTLRKL